MAAFLSILSSLLVGIALVFAPWSPLSEANWLRQLWAQDPDLIRRFREYLARCAEDEKVSRLTDHQTIERFRECLPIVQELRHLRDGETLESVMQAANNPIRFIAIARPSIVLPR